jgi:uncharacterized protein (DUF1501 family)
MSLCVTRRGAIAGAAAFGAVAWASRAAISTPEPKRARLVVLALDGGADGLSLAPPVSDAAYHRLRGELAIRRPLPFDGDFGLHPAMPKTAAMAAAGEVRLAPAAASPSLSRSHFYEQDLLQSGLTNPRGARSGWLNRAVAALGEKGPAPGRRRGRASHLLQTGPTRFGPVSGEGRHHAGHGLAPGRTLPRRAGARGPGGDGAVGARHRRTCAAARRSRSWRGSRRTPDRAALAAAEGPSAAFLPLGGFDTHVAQGADQGALAGRLRVLDGMLDALKAELGSAWSQTLVLVFTEFGRTVLPNGNGGADHGAGGAALLAGGGLKPGGLIGDWPTLARLHEDRDLRPGLDLRSLFKGVLHEHWGLPAACSRRRSSPAAPPPRS